jgi:glycosyltransferase involved in cell wall biosynthesis
MLTSVPFPPVCGIGNYVANLSGELKKRGHDVVVVTRGTSKIQIVEYDNFVLYKLPFIKLYPFHVDIHGLFVNNFLKSYKKNIDLLHIHTPLPPAIRTQLPIVTTFHTPHFSDSVYSNDIVDFRYLLTKGLAIFDYRIEKSLISSSRVVSAVAEGVKLDLERYYPVQSGKVVVFGNGVNERFLEAGRSISRKKDGLMILYVGRLDYQKGLLDLIESMSIVARKVPQARLVLVGKGPLLPQVIKRVNELDLQEKVEIKGFESRDEVLADCLSASIFVLPSHYEGLATVLLEAMACGDAVVATDVRGNSDVVVSGKTGLLVPKKEPIALANAIICLLENPDLRERLAKNARRLIEEEFTWEKVANRVLEAYLTAIG